VKQVSVTMTTYLLVYNLHIHKSGAMEDGQTQQTQHSHGHMNTLCASHDHTLHHMTTHSVKTLRTMNVHKTWIF